MHLQRLLTPIYASVAYVYAPHIPIEDSHTSSCVSNNDHCVHAPLTRHMHFHTPKGMFYMFAHAPKSPYSLA